jgi:hypothetical protein
MMEPKNPDKMNELQGYACLGVSVTVKLKGYDFFFRWERHDFVPDKGFTPFFWKRKGDDTGNDGTGHDNGDNDAPTRVMTSTSASMDVHKPQGGQSTPHAKAVPIGLGVGTVSPCVFAVTPINPNPKTPPGMQIVEEIHARALGLAGSSPQSSSELALQAMLGAAALRPPRQRGLLLRQLGRAQLHPLLHGLLRT